MDNAHQGLEGCAKPVYYPVRGSDAAAVEKFRLHKIQDTLQNGSPQHWMNMSIGRSGFWLCARVNSVKSRIAVDFHVKTQLSKDSYHALFAEKEQIENDFGGVLEWNELPENKESYVSIAKENADFRNEADWLGQFEWLANNLERLDKAFRKRVKSLVAN